MTDIQPVENIDVAALTRDEVAVIYAQMLISSPRTHDWGNVNRTIMRKWKLSGLEYIKRRAWKLAKNGERA